MSVISIAFSAIRYLVENPSLVEDGVKLVSAIESVVNQPGSTGKDVSTAMVRNGVTPQQALAATGFHPHDARDGSIGGKPSDWVGG